MARPWLYVLDLFGRRRKAVELRLDEREYRFGSDEGNEVVVRREGSEPLHCVLFARDGSAHLRNVAASTPTVYNGMTMVAGSEVRLSHRDVFAVCGRSFGFAASFVPIARGPKRPRREEPRAPSPDDVGDFAYMITGIDRPARDVVVRAIEVAGSFVLETLAGGASRISVAVIAPRPVATVKYLYAEIAALPCVSPEFATASPSEDARSLFARYRLPRLVAGSEARLNLTGMLLGFYRIAGDARDMRILVEAAGGDVVADEIAPWTAGPAAVLTNLAPGHPELEPAIAAGATLAYRGDAWIARSAMEGRAIPFDSYSS